MTGGAPASIVTVPVSSCHGCGRDGRPLYRALEDRLYGVPGTWNVWSCSADDCGLLWLNPTPEAGELHRLYETYYTHETPTPSAGTSNFRLLDLLRRGYLRRRGFYRGTESRRLAIVAPLAFLNPAGSGEIEAAVLYLPPPPSSGARLLDVGCGAGEAMSRMAAHGWIPEGIDFDQAAVAQARARGLDAQVGDLHSQCYPADHFDAIWMGHVLEHVPDPRATVAECHRILKPGGTLALMTPNSESFGHRLFGRHWRGLEVPRHLHIFNVATLKALANEATFEIVAARTLVKSAGYMMAMSMRIRAWNGRPVALRRVGVHAIWILVERIFRIASPRIGEEALLVARKGR